MWFSVDRIESGAATGTAVVVLIDDNEQVYEIDAALYLSLTGIPARESDVLEGDTMDSKITRLTYAEEETARRKDAAKARLARLRARGKQ